MKRIAIQVAPVQKSEAIKVRFEKEEVRSRFETEEECAEALTWMLDYSKSLEDALATKIRKGFYFASSSENDYVAMDGSRLRWAVAKSWSIYKGIRRRSMYGSADTVNQIIEYCTPILQNNKGLCVAITPITKADNHGWRYHKNDPFVGNRHIWCEYLGDDMSAPDTIYMFCVWERVK